MRITADVVSFYAAVLGDEEQLMRLYLIAESNEAVKERQGYEAMRESYFSASERVARRGYSIQNRTVRYAYRGRRNVSTSYAYEVKFLRDSVPVAFWAPYYLKEHYDGHPGHVVTESLFGCMAEDEWEDNSNNVSCWVYFPPEVVRRGKRHRYGYRLNWLISADASDVVGEEIDWTQYDSTYEFEWLDEVPKFQNLIWKSEGSKSGTDGRLTAHNRGLTVIQRTDSELPQNLVLNWRWD